MSKSNTASSKLLLEDLAVAGHEQVEVHGVAGVDDERRLELPIPGVVDQAGVDDVLPRHQAANRSRTFAAASIAVTAAASMCVHSPT